jgi:catechol 2,3-dioxygenase-like lactoylglutathione lyase family enzyme
MNLSHARIITKDVPALARFYQQITGIVPVSNAPRYGRQPDQLLYTQIQASQSAINGKAGCVK